MPPGSQTWNTGGLPGPVGLGLLIRYEFLSGDGHILYCPSQTNTSHIYDGVLGWQDWGEQWMSAPGYEGRHACVATGMWVRKSQRTGDQIRAIVSDLWYARQQIDAHPDGMNTAYTDGSAHWSAIEDCEIWDWYTWEDAGITAAWEVLDEEY